MLTSLGAESPPGKVSRQGPGVWRNVQEKQKSSIGGCKWSLFIYWVFSSSAAIFYI